MIGLENSNNSIIFHTDSGLTLTLNSDHSATFAGDVAVNGGRITITESGNQNELLIMNASSDVYADQVWADSGGSIRLRSHNGAFKIYTGGDANSLSANNSTEGFSLSTSQNATFAGNLILPGEEANSFKIAFTGASASSGISTVDQSGAGLYIGANSRVNNSGNVVYHDSALPSSGIYFDGWNGDDMEFYTGTSGNPSVRLTIASDGTATFAGDVTISKAATPLFKLLDTTNNISLLLGADDANTFIRSSSSANLYLQPGGSTALTLLSGGNVGIGTTSPQVSLQIGTHLTTAPADTGLCVSNRKSIRINDADGSYNFGVYIKQNYSGSSYLILGTRHNGTDTDGLVVKSGNVGIGVTTPLDRLHVKPTTGEKGVVVETMEAGQGFLFYPSGYSETSGSSYFRITGAPGVSHSLELGTSSNNGINFQTNSATKMVILGTGNVGIGLTDPDSKLHVNSGVASTSDWGNIGIISDFPINTANRIYSAYMLQDTSAPRGAAIGLSYDGTGYKMHFGTSPTDSTSLSISTALTIDRSGNVGIGTTSPDAKLDVESTHSQLRLTDSDDSKYALFSYSSSYLSIRNNSTSAVHWALDTSGNVGIGTIDPYAYDTTSTKLHVKNASAGSGAVGEVARFEGSSDADGSGGTIRLGTSNDRGMYFEGGRTSTVPYGKIGLTEYNGAKTLSMTLDWEGGTTFAGDVNIAEASNKGQLFFGTANTDYEIKGGGNYGYLSLNAPILRFDTGGTERLRIDANGAATFTEEIYVPNGSKAAPTYSFTGDTNTGMYSDAADRLSLVAGGNTTFEITATTIALNAATTLTSSNLILSGDANIELDVTPGSGNASGTIIKTGTTVVAYGTCYMLQSGPSWAPTEVEDEEFSKGLLAIGLGAGAANSVGMLTNGIYYDSAHGFSIGAPLYLVGDSGLIDDTAPSGSGDLVRVVGYAIDDNEIYFCPDTTWVILD